jgi:hypothetical protein
MMREMGIERVQILGADTDQMLPFQSRKRQTGHTAEQDNPLSIPLGSGTVESLLGGCYFVFRNATGVHQDYLALVDIVRYAIAVHQKKSHRFRE